MNSKIMNFFTLLLTAFTFLSCGAEYKKDITLSGRLNISTETRSFNSNSSVFIVVSKTMDFKNIQDDPLENIIELAQIDSNSYDFNIDLSKADVKEGDKVYLFAFITDKYESGVPKISTGDMVGFYVNPDNFDPAYTLTNGNNANIEIDVNREVYDFETSVSGNITADSEGDIVIVAYAGSIDSFNFSDIDINNVIGYTDVKRTGNLTPFTLDILPYGHNLPIESVYIFAFVDKNGNGEPDEGDLWGILSDSADYPEVITITDIPTVNLSLKLSHGISAPSSYKNSIKGRFEAPQGYGTDSPPVFMVVCKADNSDALFNNTMDSVRYFKKLPAGATYFDLDLSGSGLSAGEKVMIIAIWGKDYTSDFPRLTEGDMIGYYINKTDYTYQYVLNEGYNPPISMNINKIYKKNNCVIKGNLIGTDIGDVILIAYTGEFNSLDVTIDTEKIAGYKKLTKGASTIVYSMEILPFSNFPLQNVYIFGMLDKNKNGIPDAGDKLGFFADPITEVPGPVTLKDGINSFYNVKFLVNYVDSSAGTSTMKLSGSFPAPAGYGTDSPPVFMIVSKADNPDDLFSNSMSAIKYFKKLPAGATAFDLDLSSSGLKTGDKIMIIALWDRDYVSGFPSLSEGDMTGYYLNKNDYTYQYILNEGANQAVTLTLDKTYKKNNSAVKGTITGTETGDVILVAYTGEFNSLNTTLDTNKIIGYKKVTKAAAPLAYSMDIMPFSTFPVQNVFIFAILDKNKNGTPDNGDRLGFYSNSGTGVPSTMTLQNYAVSNVNIGFTSDFTAPVSGGTSIILNGTFQAPAGYTSNISTKPVFIMVAKADSTVDIFSNPMAAMKYFIKLPQGATSYSIELSGTGLVPGDEVMVIALWDRDYVSGFPSPSDGDMIGYYLNQADYNYQYLLKAGSNPSISLKLDKTYKTNTAEVNGNLLGNESGDVIIVAYNGEFNSLDAALDTSKIIGYQKVIKGAAPQTYSMDIFPFNSFPVQNVFIFAILDKNKNGIPDAGDRIGFYSSDSQTGIPSITTLHDGVNSGLNVQFLINYVDPAAAGTPMTLSGSILAPDGYTTSVSTKPIYIVIAKADNTFDLFGDPMASMKYFLKLPQGSTTYNINLAGLGLNPGDEIRILALWDKNYLGGFPTPDNGDKIGYYQNKNTFSFSKVLAAGANTANLTNGWSFGIDKTIYLNSGKFTFNFKQTNSGDLPASQIIGKDLIVVMIHEGGVNSSDYSITDMNYIISIDYIKNIQNLTDSHTLSMFPFIYDKIPKGVDPLSVGGVYLYVILDSNKNGCPDSGEYLGYYWTWYLLQKAPMIYPTIYYDRVNDLNQLGEIVSIFSNRTY